MIVDLDHFRRRVVQDALNSATAYFWRRRADDLRKGLTRPGDFTGNATPQEIQVRNSKILVDAARCEHLADMLSKDRSAPSDEVIQAIGEVA